MATSEFASSPHWRWRFGAGLLVPGGFLWVVALLVASRSCVNLGSSQECFDSSSPGAVGVLFALGTLFVGFGAVLLFVPTREGGPQGTTEGTTTGVTQVSPGTRPSFRTDARPRLVSLAACATLILVLAALLAPFVVAGWFPLTKTCACTPYELGMAVRSTSNPAAGLYYVELGLTPTEGLTTSWFALELWNSTQKVDAGSAPATCAPPLGSSNTTFSASTCGTPSAAWYGVLVTHNGGVAAVFDRTGAWKGDPVLVSPSLSLYVVSGTNLSSTAPVLSVYGTGSYSVSGSVYL